MSEANARIELMEAILVRAADALGDLGAPVKRFETPLTAAV